MECKLLRPKGIKPPEGAKMNRDDRFYMVFVVTAVLLLDFAATWVFLQAIA